MILDIIIIAIVAVCVISGYKKGLIGVAFHLVSFIIAILVALLLQGPISNFIIKNTQVDENIESIIIKNLDEGRLKNVGEDQITVEQENMPKIITKYIDEAIKENVNNAKNSVEDIFAEKIAIAIINVATIIILFVLVRVLLIIVNKVCNIIAKLPILSQFNKTGGILYGAIEGLFIVYVILALCVILAPILQNMELLGYINTSHIGKLMYNNNILLKFIQ